MYWGPGVCNNRAIVQMHWLYNKHMTLNDWHLEIFNHSTGTNTSEYLLILKTDSSPIFSLKYHVQYNVLTALSLAVNLHLCQMSREWNRPSRWLVFCSKNGIQLLLKLPFCSQSDNNTCMCLTQLLPFLWHLQQIKIMISVYIGKCKMAKMSNSESTGHN